MIAHWPSTHDAELSEMIPRLAEFDASIDWKSWITNLEQDVELIAPGLMTRKTALLAKRARKKALEAVLVRWYLAGSPQPLEPWEHDTFTNFGRAFTDATPRWPWHRVSKFMRGE